MLKSFCKSIFLAELKALDEIYISTVSKHDLKHCGTFLREFACDLGFAACQSQDIFLTIVTSIVEYVVNDSEMLFNELEMLC